MAEDQGYRGPFAPTSPAPKQGFAHNEESSHERGKEYRDQGSLFTYAPNGGEVEPQHHDRRNDRYDDRVIGTKTGIRKGLNIRSRN